MAVRITPYFRLALSVGCAAVTGSVAGAGFVDATAASGLSYTHAPPTSALAWSTAPAAAVDIDGDGWTDLVFGRAEASVLLYRNRGDGTFGDETAARGLSSTLAIGGIAAGDFDNDGDQDLFLVPMDGPRCRLLINDGTGHFSEQAVARGADLTLPSGQTHRGRSIAVMDYDRDGYLDLHITEYNVAAPADASRHAALLHNRGGGAPGYFENMTATRGLTQPRQGETLWGFSSAWADFDRDGWPDLALIVDFGQSQLYWNEGGTAFTEGARTAGIARDENGMGAAVADYDGDGQLDLFVSSIFDAATYTANRINSGNKLYRNLGTRRFAEVSAAAGVDRTGWAWGAAFFDPDNDGDPDLLITNGQNFGWGDDARAPFQGADKDPTTLMINAGDGTFSNGTAVAGITDRGLGRAVVVGDFDRDGDEDVVLTQAYATPIYYRNDRTGAAGSGHWLQFTFAGTTSNRDGYGAEIALTAGGRTQTLLFQPSNSFVGQRESVLHVGLGTATSVTAATVRWPSGIVQSLTLAGVDRRIALVEPIRVQQAPSFALSPTGGSWLKDSRVELTTTATGDPAPVYSWFKDGEAIPGATGPSYVIAKVHPADAGRYTVQATNPLGTATSAAADIVVTPDLAGRSVARLWNEALLDAIRRDTPNPPVHARNLFHLSAAMWDAYWPYTDEGWTRAAPLFHREEPATRGAEAQREAISHAAFALLQARFAASPGRLRSLAEFRWLMQALDYDPDDLGTDGDGPAAVGNRIAAAVLAANLDDGANEPGHYADITGYAPRNEPLVVDLPGTTMTSPSTWQPLALSYFVTQNGIPVGATIQSFVGVNAIATTPFALIKPTPTTFALDPGPPPRFGGESDAALRAEALAVIEASSWLDPTEGAMIDISPGARFNNALGRNDGLGHARNPVTGLPYAANIVNRADYARVLAEFWADGPSSETPPGHWNVLFNEVSAAPELMRRWGGLGPELSALEWDVRGYLALNGALHDAACAAWGIKWIYDSARPISLIRYMGGLGQSSDPAGPAYDPAGLPLVPDQVEVITAASAAPGERHAHLADSIGEVAIRAWRGEPEDSQVEVGGVGWIRAVDWVPYQLSTFVSPGFPGYLSGHSTFSRAGAEVLTLMTGSPYFPGGLGSYHFGRDAFLRFELGPSTDLTLQWATYYDAADQAGRSRIFGGIHISADDLGGRRLGSRIGLDAFLRAEAWRRASAPPSRGLINLSGRARAGVGNASTIAGFVIGGDAPQKMLVRGIGPTLRGLGVDDCDLDPNLALFARGGETSMLSNDDWGTAPGAADLATWSARIGAFSLPETSRDAAALVDLAPGLYTVVTSSSAGSGGVALAEVYGEHLINLSTRARVTAGEGAVIAGFTLASDEPAYVLVRGVGPTLAALDVDDVLPDPQITVYRQISEGEAVMVAGNDDWSDDDMSSLTADAGARSGAFALPVGSRDAALLLRLNAGSYTVVMRGGSEAEAAGVGLIEVYLVE